MTTPQFSGSFYPGNGNGPPNGPMPPAGHPGHPGHPGQPFLPFHPPEKRRKTSTKIIVGFGTIVLVALVAVGTFLFLHASKSALPGVGDCVRLSKDDLVDGDFETLSCSDNRALYRVESQHDGDALCPGDFAPFALREEATGPTKITLCMELNVRDGDCLTSLDDRTKTTKVGCADVGARQRIIVHQGIADDSACDPSEGHVLYPGPAPHTVCLREVPKQANV